MDHPTIAKPHHGQSGRAKRDISLPHEPSILTRKDLFYLFGIVALLGIFYPDLFRARAAALAGDHWEQHYPWAHLLSSALQNGELPLWTRLIHCGFPITAEGQIGSFYLPNLLLGALLPIRWAYAYQNIFHFTLSGLATYLYARQMKLSSAASFVSAVVFLFGSAYGGAFYNLTSLKTLAWFPLHLLCFEKFLSTGRRAPLLVLALSLAFSLLAGYLQIAILALGIFLLYALLRILAVREAGSLRQGFWKPALSVIATTVLSLALAAPQLLLTVQLAGLSNRALATEAYAYVGSLSPAALLTLFFPSLQGLLRGNCLYGGALSVFLVVCAFQDPRARTHISLRIWGWMCVISLALALGSWSPLYIGLVKATHFYAFRVPAKFLVFFCFGFAMLAGLGFGVLQETLDSSRSPSGALPRAARTYGFVAAAAALSYWALYVFLTALRPAAEQAGQWAIRQWIYGKAGHPLSWEAYREKLSLFLDSVRTALGLQNPWTTASIGLLAATLALAWKLARPERMRNVWLAATVLFLITDLYAAAFWDIKRDFMLYDHAEPRSAVFERLKQEKESGALTRLFGIRGSSGSLPVVPSANMLYGIEDLGAYSPLVLARYFETIGQLGNVNDSTSAVSPSKEFVLKRLNLLAFLDVSHILTAVELSHPDLLLIEQDAPQGPFLYRTLGNHARVSVVSKMIALEDWESVKLKLMEPDFDPRKQVLLERTEAASLGARIPKAPQPQAKIAEIARKNDSERWQVSVTGPGFLIFAQTAYPGWRAFVNGEEVPLLKAYGLFQGVFLKTAGSYTVTLRYEPFSQLSRT